MKRRLVIGAGILFMVILLTGALSGGDVIDLPEWANVPGIDLPIVGDTDQLDCRLALLDDDGDPETPRLVEITIVDGDAATYPDYTYVFNNNRMLREPAVERVSADRLIVPVLNDATEQFFAIATEPVREGRVFCESIVVE